MLNSLASSLAATLEESVWPGFADRAVLVLNHLLRSQGSASQRLAAYAGKSLRIDWRGAEPGWPKPPSLRLQVTPAGLFESLSIKASERDGDAAGDALRIEVELPAPLAWPRALVERRRPATRIEGDTQFAADLAWLTEHLRWNAEDDLARLVGDVPARMLATAGLAVQGTLRGLMERLRSRTEGQAGTGAAPPR